MGMSTNVVGVKPPDSRWKQMKDVWDACEEAGISPPREVEEFFNGERPDDAGVVVGLAYPRPHPAVTELGGGGGYEVNLKDLPADITILRFTNSW